jgi:hypothetical protein
MKKKIICYPLTMIDRSLNLNLMAPVSFFTTQILTMWQHKWFDEHHATNKR